MTLDELKECLNGTRVRYWEGTLGTVFGDHVRKWIRWDDGIRSHLFNWENQNEVEWKKRADELLDQVEIVSTPRR